jgi:hypothetical protein
MDRRTRNVFLVGLLVLLGVFGAAAVLLGGSSTTPGGSANAPSVVGVIVGLESEGLSQVRAFDLRIDGGAIEAFRIGQLENAATLPPGHLAEHQATAQPVKVWYETEGDVKVAIRIEDAP